MEHTATRRELFERLTEVYRCLLAGTGPRLGAADVAGLILSGVCGLVPGEEDSMELSCISVTLVEKITSSLMSHRLSPSVGSYCQELLALLLHMDLMRQLIHQFQTEERIISHLAAKTVSSCVFYQLCNSGTVSPVWQQKCVQAFHSSAPGPELDSCLWSLTEVLKRLLKGAHQDILWKHLAAFDSSLNALCSKFLPDDRKEVQQCSVDEPWGTTLCLLLDLLETLTASSLMCEADAVCLSLKSHRITYIHSSALLTTISSSSQYFVKKRALLLLKRAVLQKAGEDWALGGVLLPELRYSHYSSDMSLLAHSVLTAVAADWLQSVPVESASFFGGTRHDEHEEGQKADCVMLRAVSLLLLKSMELHIQTAGMDTEVSGYLQSLWSFLRRSSVQLTEVTHRCCWVSLLFGEQDDDMMEAAKALLSIFLHHRRCSGRDDSSVLEAACSSGCNPHCHFLLLLQSVSFDHSILLDFLISTETCFLEYLVRYLKYLRADWQGFTAACGRIGSSHGPLSPQRSLPASSGCQVMKAINKKEPDPLESSSCLQPAGVISPAGFHLVAYDSSDESDPDNMEVCQAEPGRCVPPLPVRQEQYESPDSGPISTLEEKAEGSSCPNMSGQTCETLARAVLCMSELRLVVSRLHTKKLFPYNPSSLLNLLAQVENCSSQSPPVLFNK